MAFVILLMAIIKFCSRKIYIVLQNYNDHLYFLLVLLFSFILFTLLSYVCYSLFAFALVLWFILLLFSTSFSFYFLFVLLTFHFYNLSCSYLLHCYFLCLLVILLPCTNSSFKRLTAYLRVITD